MGPTSEAPTRDGSLSVLSLLKVLHSVPTSTTLQGKKGHSVLKLSHLITNNCKDVYNSQCQLF